MKKHSSRISSLASNVMTAALLAALLSGKAGATPPGTGWTLTFDKEFTSLPQICQTVGSATPGWLPCDYWNTHHVADMDSYFCFPGIDTGYNAFSVSTGSEGISVLNITANTPPPGMNIGSQHYVSGELTTAAGANYSTDIQSNTPFGQEYGYFECRCKLPTGQGQGYWPAFWMMPADGSSTAEYDIFEVLGNAATGIHQTAHWNNYGNVLGNDYIGPDTSTGFHTYGFEWDANYIHWYVDGVLTETQPNYINKPMYVMFDLAVGGSWPGEPNASTVFPGSMQIEYLRVYSGGSVGGSGYLPNGTYVIAVQSSGKAMGSGGSITSGSAIVPETVTAGDTTGQWILTNLGAGYYSVINKQSGLALDNNGSTTNSTNLIQATYTGSTNQQWAIAAASVSGGYFKLTNRTSGLVADATLSGTNVAQYTNNGNNPNQFWTFSGTLPSGWSNQDVGAVSQAGSTTYASGTFTLNGCGSDIWLTSDQFQYASMPITGDATIVARVASQVNTNGNAKAGVMMRNGLATGDIQASTLVEPTNPLAFEYRLTAGGSTTAVQTTAHLAAPYWVKLARVANIFTSYDSPDGVNWTQVGTESVSMNSSYYAGLAVCSHNTSTMGTATFDNVQVLLPTQVLDVSVGTGITINGAWTQSTATSGYHGSYYLHDGDTGGGKSVVFTPNLPSVGNYQVYAWWTAGSNRASNVPVTIATAGGSVPVTVNQTTSGGAWVSLGTYAFNAGTGGSVTISDTGTNGYVIANAVEFVKQ